MRGQVTVLGSTRAVIGATVYTDRGEIATTDLDGYFWLEIAADEHELNIVATGYETRTIRITADDLLHIELAPASGPRAKRGNNNDTSAAEGSEVIEVRGKAPEETKPLSYQLSSDEIHELPGAGNDVLRAAQVLPGVARIPYSFGGLVLRGTSPRDTAVYLDGIEVPLAFHFGGITSFYPSGMLGELQVISGGFGADYGRAEGGLVSLTTREPRTDKWRLSGEVGLLESGAMAEGPIGNGGIIVGVRRSYFDLVIKPFVDADIPLPSYWDAQIRASFGDPLGSGRIAPMAFLSIDNIANDAAGNGGRGLSITQLFVRVAAPYTKVWGPLTLHVVPWLGLDRLTYEDSDNPQLTKETFERPLYPGGLRADLTRDTTWGHLRGGLDSEGGYLSHSTVGFSGAGDGPAQQTGASTLGWADLAVWGEARIKLDGERFAVKPGVRLDGYGLTGEWVVDPRVNIHEKLTDTITLRQALGRYHQPPTPADVDPTDGNPKLQSSYYDQASLGVEAQLSASTFASLTGFANYGYDIGIVEPTNRPGDAYEPNLGGLGPTFQLLLEKELGFSFYRENVGRAKDIGAELLVKYTVGRWFGMISYTLSRAQRTDDPARTQTPGADSYLWRPFELDQRHNLNLAGSVGFTHWRFGARVQLVSGNPYTPTTCDPSGDGICTAHPWAGTLPVFFQLDVRADRRWHRCWGDVNLYFDIQNVTNRRNVEGREFSQADMRDEDIPGLTIVPFIGVEFIPK